MPSPASDAINRLVVKAVAVALTFPVAAEIYWFVNHLPKDLNEESFPNGGGKKTFSWLMSVGFWCENMSVKNLSSSIYVRRSRSRRSFIRLRADIQPHDTLTAISADEPMHSSSEILSMLIMR